MEETDKKPTLILGAIEFGSPKTILEWRSTFLKKQSCFYYGAEWIWLKLNLEFHMIKLGVRDAIKLASNASIIAFWNHRCRPDNVERVIRRAPDKRIVGQ
jgi:hypothetical protein